MPKLWADSLDEHRSLVLGRLVDAFVALVEERPLDEVTVAAVAERAGLARSAVYNHVDHLHDLALVHSERVIAQWVASLAEHDQRPASERLTVLVESSLRTFADDPIGGMDLSGHLDEARFARLLAILAPVRDHVVRICRDGVASGEFVDRDAGAVAEFVWAVIGGYRTAVGTGRLDTDATIRLATEFLLRALGADDDRGSPGTGG